MPSRLLLDVGPATGAHGARGIGRSVRGLVDAIGEWSVERRERIWALGLPGDTLDHFEERAVSSESLGWRPVDTGWLLGRVATSRALRRAHARVLHSTDPHRPWPPGGVRRLVTAYDLIPLREAALLRSWRPNHRLGYRWYLRQIVHADAVIAISHATADDLVRLLGVPEYQVEESGPDHQKSFRAFVLVGGEVLGTGEGRSKKAAEQQAAEAAWMAISARIADDGPGGGSAGDTPDARGAGGQGCDPEP